MIKLKRLLHKKWLKLEPDPKQPLLGHRYHERLALAMIQGQRHPGYIGILIIKIKEGRILAERKE
jgi:hypothetical protein